jgi:hypothetical protein
LLGPDHEHRAASLADCNGNGSKLNCREYDNRASPVLLSNSSWALPLSNSQASFRNTHLAHPQKAAAPRGRSTPRLGASAQSWLDIAVREDFPSWHVTLSRSPLTYRSEKGRTAECQGADNLFSPATPHSSRGLRDQIKRLFVTHLPATPECYHSASLPWSGENLTATSKHPYRRPRNPSQGTMGEARRSAAERDPRTIGRP